MGVLYYSFKLILNFKLYKCFFFSYFQKSKIFIIKLADILLSKYIYGDMIMFNYTSTIGIANPKSNSLRAGLPKEIVKVLDVKPGDKLDWNVDVNNDKITVTVKKLE